MTNALVMHITITKKVVKCLSVSTSINVYIATPLVILLITAKCADTDVDRSATRGQLMPWGK